VPTVAQFTPKNWWKTAVERQKLVVSDSSHGFDPSLLKTPHPQRQNGPAVHGLRGASTPKPMAGAVGGE